MDQEVAKTLGELELKLQELERELTTVGGHRDTPSEPPHAPGKLIDEAVEQDGSSASGIDGGARPGEAAALDGDAFGGAALFGGEEVPAQSAASQTDWAGEVRETAYGEIPTEPPTPSPPLPSPPPPLPPPSSSPSEPPQAPFTGPPGLPSPSIPPGLHTPTPQPPDPRRPAAVEENRSVDLAELVRFRDKLTRTMDELIEEYSRLLSVEPPSHPRPDA